MSSISESYKKTPVTLNHFIDFTKVVDVPDSHKWNLPTDKENGNHSMVMDEFSVPVIDLADPRAISLIKDACETWGVFQVMNHGISNDILDAAQIQIHELFSLPMETKLAARRAKDVTGYGLPRIANFCPKVMWCEGFSIMGSPALHAKQLWPEQPDLQTKFCCAMEKYQDEMKRLTEKLLEIMLNSLGLAAEDVDWFAPSNGGQSEAQAVLHINFYPKCPNPNEAMGFPPHTDSSAITLLYQNDISGLQVFRDGIGWTTVKPLPGAIVVNLGDLIHILSNGAFKSVVHRVKVNNESKRISIGYFYGPPSSVQVAPSAKLTDTEHPPLYRSVTWKDYLDKKAVCFDKVLDFLKI